MKIPESWIEKIIIGVQAVVVAVYIWFTFRHEIKQKQKAARRIGAQQEKEMIRFTKAKYKQKRKNLNKRPGKICEGYYKY